MVEWLPDTGDGLSAGADGFASLLGVRPYTTDEGTVAGSSGALVAPELSRIRVGTLVVGKMELEAMKVELRVAVGWIALDGLLLTVELKGSMVLEVDHTMVVTSVGASMGPLSRTLAGFATSPAGFCCWPPIRADTDIS